MPLTIWNCVLSYKQKIYFSANHLVLPEISFRTEFPGSNFLLPTFLTGGKWDFQVANLLLATVNFEPCIGHVTGTLPGEAVATFVLPLHKGAQA